MTRKRMREDAGLSLMEVTLAVALFAVMVGLGAQTLAVNYAALDIQEQRIEAVQRCRGVLADLRERRVNFQEANDGFNMAGFLRYLEDQNDSNWPLHTEEMMDGTELKDLAISVTALNLEGDGADATDQSLQVHVVTTWTDRQGRQAQARLATILTDR